jgi:hypothetical protein
MARYASRRSNPITTDPNTSVFQERFGGRERTAAAPPDDDDNDDSCSNRCNTTDSDCETPMRYPMPNNNAPTTRRVTKTRLETRGTNGGSLAVEVEDEDDEESHKAVVVLRVPPAGMEMEVTTEDEECRGCDDPNRGLETNFVRARRVET